MSDDLMLRQLVASVDEQIRQVAADRGLNLVDVARTTWPDLDSNAARARLERTRRGGVWLRALVAVADALDCDVEIRLVPWDPVE